MAVVCAPPARNTPVVKNGAGMTISRRDRHGRATRTKATGEGGRVFVRCSSITQLAVGIESPARDLAIVKNGAGVVLAG